MSQRPGREGLDRNSGILEGPRLAQLIDDRRGIVGSAISVKEASLRFQNLLGAGPAEGGQIGGYHPALSRMTGLKRLHHGAEVLAQARSLAGSDRKCAGRVSHIQPFEPARTPRCRQRRHRCRWSETHLRSGGARWLPRSCIPLPHQAGRPAADPCRFCRQLQPWPARREARKP